MGETIFITFGIFAVSLYGLMRGADLLIDGGGDVARKFQVSELFIGLTIIALGTSLPELVVSLRSAVLGNVGLAYANVIGSNITNVLLCLGACAMISPLHSSKGIQKDVPFYFFLVCIFSLFVLVFANYTALEFEAYLGKAAGAVLLSIFCLYIYRVYGNRRLHIDEIDDDMGGHGDPSLLKSTMLILIGGALLIIGGDYAVKSAIKIASLLGVSETMIGLTIVALGTSLPEAVASITAAYKGKGDIAVGNILGSNVMNITLVLGSSALLNDLTINLQGVIDLAMHFIVASLFCFCMLKKSSPAISKQLGTIFVGLYVGCRV